MEWVNFEEKKPEHDCVAMVANEKGYMKSFHLIRAFYHKSYDVWVLYDPTYRDPSNITLQVSHYIVIPAGP